MNPASTKALTFKKEFDDMNMNLSRITTQSVMLVLLLSPCFSAYANHQQTKIRHAQAMQFGLFFGGYASQYDECASRGLVPETRPSAVSTANAYLSRIYLRRHDPQDLNYARKGWRIMQNKLKNMKSGYWKSNCPRIRKQWQKYVAMLKLHG